MPHLFIFAGLPMLALILMGAMSVGMWLMSTGPRKLIGLVVLGMLAAAWRVGSYELAAGALAVSICPLVFMSLIDRVSVNTVEFGRTLEYLECVLVALDLLANALLGGSPYETLSSVAYRMSLRADPHWRWRLARRVIERLFWWEPGHCQIAYEAWLKRSQFTPDFNN